jgi:hypothetical protein
MKRADAGRDIARKLTKMGFRHPSGKPITGSQVAKWREKMMTERADENRAVAQYQLALVTVKAMKPLEAVEFLMRSMPQLYPPNFPKTPHLNGKIIRAPKASEPHELRRPKCPNHYRIHRSIT